MLLVWYISGHGFGHASRAVEVINAIQRRAPAKIVIRTAVARWFIEASVEGAVDLQHAAVDTGVVQIDSLRPDEVETARRAAAFYANFAERAAQEAAFLQDAGASAVVGDIPPLAFAAADRAKLPSIAMGNFTWDWIYGGYPQFERLAPGVLPLVREAYAQTTLALRLPLHGGFEPMRRVIRDIPLVARRSERGRDATRIALGIPLNALVVLSSFGGFGLDLPYNDIARQNRFTLLVTDHELRDQDRPAGDARLRCVTRAEQRHLGLKYEDLVSASAVVVSKPGYGIVSECIANGAALLYTSRGRFLEQDMFIEQMPRVLRCRFIDQRDLRAGRWSDAIDALLDEPPPPESLATNGADVAAQEILSITQTAERGEHAERFR